MSTTGKDKVHCSWLEPRIGVRTRWKRDRAKYWKLGILTLIVVLVVALRDDGNMRLSGSLLLFGLGTYVFLFVWDWAYSFARCVIWISDTQIVIRNSTIPYRLRLDQISEVQVGREVGLIFLRLKLQRGKEVYVFLAPEISVFTLAPILCKYGSQWKEAEGMLGGISEL